MKNSLFFDSYHSDLIAEIDSFTKTHAEFLESSDSSSHAIEIVKLLGSIELLKLTVPATYGGKFEKLDSRSLCLAREHLAYRSALADLMFTMQGLGSNPITIAGSEELKLRYLPGVAKGEMIAAFAITEPGAGSDAGAMQTLAVKDGNDYLLNGTKIYISNAGIADFYTTIVRTDSGKHGISAFVVDAKSDGLSVEPLEMIAPHPIGKLRFEGCRVKASQMLGQPGDGYKIALANLDTFRPTVGAAAIGFGRRAMDESLQHAKRRVQFGKPLSDFQAIQFKLAEMATELDAATLLVYRAAHLKDSGAGRTTKEAAMAKLFATEAAQRVIDEAVQIHGGSGLVKGAITERLYRDIRAMRIYEGTSEIQKLIIAGQLLKD